MPSEKKNQEKPAVDVNAMIDQLVANAQKALEEYMKLDQEQVDKIVHAMALAVWTIICRSPSWPMRKPDAE